MKVMKSAVRGSFFAMIFMAILSPLLGQSPDKMSYQAILRDENGSLLANRTVNVVLSIRKDQPDGPEVFSEQHNPTTNQNGLVSLEIGSGTALIGTMSGVDWADGTHYIQTRIDPAGGNQFLLITTSPLLSVPYAFHAKTADQLTEPLVESDPVFSESVAAGITEDDTTSWNAKQDRVQAGNGIDISNNTISLKNDAFYLGQDTLGGIVFYLYKDRNGNQRGLVVSKTETSAAWQSLQSATGANRSWDGPYNTARITNSPARTWLLNTFDDAWYLPSIDEMSLLYHSRFHVNAALSAGGHTLLSNTMEYWSSTEANAANAHNFHFLYGSAYLATNKSNSYNVRAIRAF
jgi:hypothetical protein